MKNPNLKLNPSGIIPLEEALRFVIKLRFPPLETIPIVSKRLLSRPMIPWQIEEVFPIGVHSPAHVRYAATRVITLTGFIHPIGGIVLVQAQAKQRPYLDSLSPWLLSKPREHAKRVIEKVIKHHYYIGDNRPIADLADEVLTAARACWSRVAPEKISDPKKIVQPMTVEIELA